MAESPSGITKERQDRRQASRAREGLLREAARIDRAIGEQADQLERERDRLLLAAWEAGATYSEIAACTGHAVSWVIRHLGQARTQK